MGTANVLCVKSNWWHVQQHSFVLLPVWVMLCLLCRSVDAASEGMLQGAMMMQLPPALASWVDSLAATTTESSSTPGRGVGVGAQSP